MHHVVQQFGSAKITLVDAIGNDIPIPMQFCVTYSVRAGDPRVLILTLHLIH
jgi:hypothetical protein